MKIRARNNLLGTIAGFTKGAVTDGACDEADGALALEGEVKTSTTIALAAMLSGSPAAYAQTEQPTPYHHYRSIPGTVAILTSAHTPGPSADR